MTKKHSIRRSLVASILVLCLCITSFVGTTFAWFTDSVTSAGNKIVSGTLKVDLELLDKESGDWSSLKKDKDPVFTYANWEPAYIDAKVLKVENEGSLALKWKAKFVSSEELGILADVIDVYVLAYGVLDDEAAATNVAYPASRDLEAEGYKRVGTVREFVNTIESTTVGELLKGQSAYLGIALKMQETAGNDYKEKSLGDFDIQILATQLASEEDSFDNSYDDDASFVTSAGSLEDLLRAIENGDDVLLTDTIVISEDTVIDGNGITVYRTEDMASNAPIFNVSSGCSLTLADITVDGGADWSGEIDPVLQRGTVNSGITTGGAIVNMASNSHLVLEDGAILQNNDGANAVHLNTRVGCTLTIDGGEIINNHSAAGAIWGGGAITLNSGKVNGNHGGIGGAIRVVTNVGTVLTMNGGEMNHNKSDGVGGAIWAGGSKSNNVYVLNGGEMAYNYSPEAGGAMYAGYYETVKIGGDFKMHDNSAPAAGAIRFYDHASLVMTGGEIYDNGDNALFLYNNSASITGGTIVGDFGYAGGLGLTIGAADIDGVIAYNLSTNHNTAYLAAEFNSFKFTVDEADANFANFNFKPAAGYTYTDGDEAKLICMNEGYETYWDAASGTFRLRAD